MLHSIPVTAPSRLCVMLVRENQQVDPRRLLFLGHRSFIENRTQTAGIKFTNLRIRNVKFVYIKMRKFIMFITAVRVLF